MTDLRKAAELALEALEDVFDLKNKDVEAIQALRQALAQTEKPPVKSYCGGKPNYCTPEETLTLDRGCWERGCVAYDERYGDGVNISAERVDETAKREHEEKNFTPS